MIEGDGMLAAAGIKIPKKDKPASSESGTTGKFVSQVAIGEYCFLQTISVTPTIGHLQYKS